MDDIIPQVETWILGNYAATAASALWIADYIETLPTEFRSIWKRKMTGTSCCKLYSIFLEMEQISSAKQKLQWLLFVKLWLSLQPMSDPWDHSRIHYFKVWAGYIGHLQTLHFESSREQLAIVFLILGYDIFIFMLTAVKTMQHAMEMHRLGQPGITQVIIRDAFLYFLVITIKVTLKSGNSNNFSGFVTPFFNILPNLLISRLMLNLRTYSESGNTTTSEGQQTHVSSLNFASNQMLGNIGAPLDGGSFNEEEEAEEDGMEMEGFRA
ncbi:hypothetical protein F5877DRAFT_65530 [Lentinula edodes]|nr:hypothetical protein F5877DRAFT_65530 [Lentinula edodes]